LLPLVVLALLGFAVYAGFGFGLARHTAPAAPAISASPAEVSNNRTPSFTFSDKDSIEKFQCSLDGSSFTDCGTTNPATETASTDLADGLHTFQVRAVDSGGISPATLYTWTIDLTAPTVLSITRAGPSPTNASTVSWTVKFSEDVTGVDAEDFALSRAGALTGGSIGDLTPLAGPGAYTVTSTTGTGDGTIGLSLVDESSISDDAGNALKDGDFTGPSYAIDKTGPATAPGLPPAPGQPISHTALPAVPAITAKPAPLGNQTAANFRFTGEAGAKLLCSLDQGVFAACASPRSYSGLRAGSHTFQVEARNAAGSTGPAASYTWTIDTTPPAINVSFPADGDVYNDKSWSNGCRGGAGACASAADASGIAAEEISILQRSSTRYWNGSTFNSPTEAFKAFTGGRYPLSLLPDGLYTIRVRATDNAGNTTPAGAYRTVHFRIKTTKPPKPVFDSTPADPTASPGATFAWHDAASPVTYLCSADNGSFSPTVPSQGRPRRPCASPLSYVAQRTNNGVHRFAVVAVDAAGNVSDAAEYSWTVAAGSIRDFTISGNANGLLYPGGPARQIPLTLTNPNAVAVTVTALTVTPDYSGLPSGCSSTAFTVTQSNVATRQLVIPPHSSVTLPSGGTTAPTVQLANAGDQDRCKNAHVGLTYRGSAHS
jgi:hypothetical protein